MKKIGNIISYITAYIQADSRELRDKASYEARIWLAANGIASPHYTDEYRNNFSAFSEAYLRASRRAAARAAISANK